MEESLKLISGLSWSVVYLVLIYQGFKHKSYGMPFLALGLNFAWEFYYSFYKLDIDHISLQRGINIFWFILDSIIVYQYFKFGKQHFTKHVKSNLFIPWSVIALAVCFMVEYLFLYEFGPKPGAKYSAFLQNLIMSFLFIDLLIRRGYTKELSMVVAVCKCIGTLAPTLLFGADNNFILGVGLLCFVIDLIYIGLLYHLRKRAIANHFKEIE